MNPFMSNTMNAFACCAIRRSMSALMIMCLLHGCMPYEYKPEPVNTNALARQINSWSLDNPDLNSFLLANGIHQETINNNVFSLDRLYLTSLFYHPEMQVAYRKLQKAEVVAEHSGFRINPGLSIPLEHHSETSGGQSQWTIGAVLSFIYERKDKREARQAEAEVGLLNARLALDQLAVDIFGRIEKLYQDYLVSRARITETKSEIEILQELLDQLQEKYELGSVSQFEISTVKLELQQRKFEFSLQENIEQGYKDQLLSMTQLPHSEFSDIEIEYIHPLQYARSLYRDGNFSDSDINSLQTRLLDSHLDLAQRLNNYAQSEAALRLEIEKQYPDIELSPGFIFDQSDNIWTLGTSWILPFLTNTEQELHILEALEERKIRQQEIISLQKQLLNRLYQNYNSVNRYGQSISVSDEIVTAVEQRADELQTQIELGGIDRIALLRNRMEYYKARQTQLQVYSEAITAMLEFKNLLQDTHAGVDPVRSVTLWIANMVKINSNEPAY